MKYNASTGVIAAIKYDMLVGLAKTFAVAIALMSALVILVNSIPNEPIADHVRRSMSPWNYVRTPIVASELGYDYYTECIAATIGMNGSSPMSVAERAFLSPTLGDCERAKTVFDNNGEGANNYWRFWHGYQVISRPFLYFFDLITLSYITFLGFFLSLYIFVDTIITHAGMKYGAFTVAALLCVPMESPPYLFSHGLIWIIAFSAGAWLLRTASRSSGQVEEFLQFFLAVGIMTSFFGMLLTPLVTLTIPLLGLYWLSKDRRVGPWWLSWRWTAVFCFTWGVGFAACWLVKWVIVLLFFNVDLNELLSVIQLRLSGKLDFADINIFNSLKFNLWQARRGFALLACFLVICTVRCVWAQDRPSITRSFGSVSKAMTCAIIFALPFAWFSILVNHSLDHHWFAAMILYPTFALAFSLIYDATLRPQLQTKPQLAAFKDIERSARAENKDIAMLGTKDIPLNEFAALPPSPRGCADVTSLRRINNA